MLTNGQKRATQYMLSQCQNEIYTIIKKYCLVTPLYLVEDLVDKIHIVSGGQQDGVHHVVDVAVLLLYATQTGVAVPSI